MLSLSRHFDTFKPYLFINVASVLLRGIIPLLTLYLHFCKLQSSMCKHLYYNIPVKGIKVQRFILHTHTWSHPSKVVLHCSNIVCPRNNIRLNQYDQFEHWSCRFEHLTQYIHRPRIVIAADTLFEHALDWLKIVPTIVLCPVMNNHSHVK